MMLKTNLGNETQEIVYGKLNESLPSPEIWKNVLTSTETRLTQKELYICKEITVFLV